MKNLILIISIIITFSNSAQASNWYCEADCGRVIMKDLGGAFSYYLAPFYEGTKVAGEGNSILSAFNTMKSSCKVFLHNGFDTYAPGSYIKLNTRVSPKDVCQEL